MLFIHPSTAAIWQTFLESLSQGTPCPADADVWTFANNEKDANELSARVVAGIKTATCSLIWEYEANAEALPQVGNYSILSDWNGEPLCVIQTVEVRVMPFNPVEAAFAYDDDLWPFGAACIGCSSPKPAPRWN